MTHFALDALAAGKGDALVLRWGTDDESHLALIDGGPSTTWDNAVDPHLHDLAGTNPAGQPNPVVLQLVVVSHVDDDHIAGIIDLANTSDAAQKQARPAPATVGDITAGAQSVAQGRKLDRILKTIKVDRNTSFSDRGDFVREGAGLSLEGLHVTVLAPNMQLLDQLKREWKKELKKILKKEADNRKARVSALAAAFDDPSIPNQSSIVLLVEFAGKKMLLTGDARGDQLIDALKNSPAITKMPLKVDLLKVPHHGSAHSNGTKLFEAVMADHYVISGNGEHGNPHPATLNALFETQRGRTIALELTTRPTAGAVRPADVKKANAAQKILDAAQSDPNVTIIYRDDDDLAVTVDLTRY
jgi:beta-lactamase superfamily II metal-dependent hydrolase